LLGRLLEFIKKQSLVLLLFVLHALLPLERGDMQAVPLYTRKFIFTATTASCLHVLLALVLLAAGTMQAAFRFCSHKWQLHLTKEMACDQRQVAQAYEKHTPALCAACAIQPFAGSAKPQAKKDTILLCAMQPPWVRVAVFAAALEFAALASAAATCCHLLSVSILGAVILAVDLPLLCSLG
jgi:hypothetical protein